MNKTSDFLSRAWADLHQDKGWWKPILILALVSLIPIVGSLYVAGYMLNWAKEAAWGMHRGIPRKAGDVGKLLKWGFFEWVIVLVWTIIPTICGSILGLIPILGVLLSLACDILAVIAAVLAVAASVRMTIYDKLGTGLQIKRILNMAKQDVNGLARCFGICLLMLIPFIIATVILVIPLVPIMFTSMQAIHGGLSTASVIGLAGAGLAYSIFAIVVCYVASVFVLVVDALATRAFGFWIAQFQPAKWGGPDAPMPYEKVTIQQPAPVAPQAAPAAPESEIIDVEFEEVKSEPAAEEPAAAEPAEEPAAEEPAEEPAAEEPAEEPAAEEPAEDKPEQE